MYCVVAKIRRLISESISNSSSPAPTHSAMEPWQCCLVGAHLRLCSKLASTAAALEEIIRAAMSKEKAKSIEEEQELPILILLVVLVIFVFVYIMYI
jgi:hypothetical protein